MRLTIFLWILNFCGSVLWGSICFPCAELELFVASLEMTKQSTRVDSMFESHVNNEMYKVLVAYVHSQAEFEACPTKVFLVITLNV